MPPRGGLSPVGELLTMEISGKVVVITGGGQGIGRGTALEFAREGAKVVIADIDKEAGKAVISEIQKIGAEGLLVLADVSKSSECQKVVKETVQKFGTINILFNNVGIQSPSSYHNVENTSEELWDRILITPKIRIGILDVK